MRILFCGGGTAGHVNPAIAIAQTFKRNYPMSKIAYVATLNGIENELVRFKKYYIDVIGFKRALSFKNVTFLVKMIKAINDSKRIIEEFRPNIVFGTGGYATYPVISAAKKMGIKTVLHESNVIPGKAILALESKADKIFVNFEETKDYLKCSEKIIRTGNPVRSFPDMEKLSEIKKSLGIKTKYIILCVGGSLGAERINNAVFELIDNYLKYKKDVTLVWSTGIREYDNVCQRLKLKNLNKLCNLIVSKYFENLLDYISVSDIVVSRAGAMSISELALLGKCSILIPSPNVTNNHQVINARTLEKANASCVITEDKLFDFVDVVKELLGNERERKMLGENIKHFAVRDSNRLIMTEMLDLL